MKFYISVVLLLAGASQVLAIFSNTHIRGRHAIALSTRERQKKLGSSFPPPKKGGANQGKSNPPPKKDEAKKDASSPPPGKDEAKKDASDPPPGKDEAKKDASNPPPGKDEAKKNESDSLSKKKKKNKSFSSDLGDEMTCDAIASDCNILLNSDFSLKYNDTCSYKLGSETVEAYNPVCLGTSGNCCIYTTNNTLSVDQVKKYAIEFLGCRGGGGSTVNAHITVPGGSLCIAGERGCGDCFEG
ncbi:hypothetical protein BD779DRAFT_416358 [Infundibulicybe gibba]|nr:hypothetical protein BD779DRAFT_416358 [Infundibulicybe gibba]